ncbi:Transforming growth factor beta regulator 1 [Dictyocoela muelleri]|nr:Transforming growth factor beta regulator 1 [Dictyocoela muelleri]
MTEDNNLINRLKNAITLKQDLKKQISNLIIRIDEKKRNLQNLYTVIKYDDAVSEVAQNQGPPILAGNSQNRMSVICLGKLPEINHDLYHSTNVIYPPGYIMRRRFKSHKYYTRKPGKIFYTCKIVGYPDFFEISTNDGYKWVGVDLWDNFVKSFNDRIDEYKCIEDFFGLTHPSIQKYIEDLGDLTSFKNYIPMKDRVRKKTKSKK